MPLSELLEVVMPKEEKESVRDDLPEDATIDAVIETLNLFASIEQDSQSAEDADAAAAESKAPAGSSNRS
jgi:hypothetical protein